MMAAPGWIPPKVTRTNDDCARMCFSCITGVHPRRLRYIDPSDERVPFWDDWRELAVEKGFLLTLMFSAEYSDPLHERGGPWPFANDELWMAGVPSKLTRGGHHAVVMRGQELHYDCCDEPRVRRPKRINHGWKVTPLV